MRIFFFFCRGAGWFCGFDICGVVCPCAVFSVVFSSRNRNIDKSPVPPPLATGPMRVRLDGTKISLRAFSGSQGHCG
jgi:hypothetical protein